LKVLHRFHLDDGAHPAASLINVKGTLYGTTYGGGAKNAGTVFSITTTGKEKVLHSFSGGRSDGAYPYASLINVNGTLYGTTTKGGSRCGSNLGCGTVFSVTTTGTEKVVHSFRGGTGGADPLASLINVNGTLYGTTYTGGSSCSHSGCGTVFALTP
jgi:uncharacterized repeat protein (TIGR03803 family)